MEEAMRRLSRREPLENPHIGEKTGEAAETERWER